MKLTALLEKMIILEGDIKYFIESYFNIHYGNYIEHDYKEQNLVAFNDDFGYS